MSGSTAGYVIAGLALVVSLLGVYGGTTWRNGPTRIGWVLIVVGVAAFAASIIKEYNDHLEEQKRDAATAQATLTAAAFTLSSRSLPLVNGRRSKDFRLYPGKNVNLHGFNCHISYSYTYKGGDTVFAHDRHAVVAQGDSIIGELEIGDSVTFRVDKKNGERFSYVNISMPNTDCQGSMAIEGGVVNFGDLIDSIYRR